MVALTRDTGEWTYNTLCAQVLAPEVEFRAALGNDPHTVTLSGTWEDGESIKIFSNNSSSQNIVHVASGLSIHLHQNEWIELCWDASIVGHFEIVSAGIYVTHSS